MAATVGAMGGGPPRGPVEQQGLGAWLAVRHVGAWAWERPLELLGKAACSALSHGRTAQSGEHIRIPYAEVDKPVVA